jgi:hypothetical protein
MPRIGESLQVPGKSFLTTRFRFMKLVVCDMPRKPEALRSMICCFVKLCVM